MVRTVMRMRWALGAALAATLIIGSLAAAVAWRRATEPAASSDAVAVAAPASRNIFPKVLNH
jgi:hypothetical protein